MSNLDLALQFFLQVAVILLACRAVGWCAGRMGQPQVVAEMVTGVLLGPSFLGWLAPDCQRLIFPWDPAQTIRDTQAYLFPVAQLGLALYMFVVGVEFRLDMVKGCFRSAISVSLAGMIVPFVLGAAVAVYLHGNSDMFPATTNLRDAMLFSGASMCVTAFPMLARIIHHKRLSGTTMGTVAISAGAINDALAWCLLAVVLASIDHEPQRAVWNAGGGIGFVVGAIFVLRPLFAWLQGRWTKSARLSETGFAVCLATMSLCAWFTDRIGLHAVFGAFVFGAILPRGVLTEQLQERITPLTVALILPLFFTYSGLHTEIGLLHSSYHWIITLLVLAVAIVGKGVACCWAARWTGLSQRDSLGIGILMNTRGMMELIIINIGLQKGLISRELFAVLVIMAVATTLMTSPAFDQLVAARREPAHAPS